MVVAKSASSRGRSGNGGAAASAAAARGFAVACCAVPAFVVAPFVTAPFVSPAFVTPPFAVPAFVVPGFAEPKFVTREFVAAELALISNFLMNDAWTFSARIGSNHGPRAKFHRFLKFNAVCGIGLLLNIVILNILFNMFGMNRYLANAVAIVLVTLWNYTLNLKFGWRTTEPGTGRRRRP